MTKQHTLDEDRAGRFTLCGAPIREGEDANVLFYGDRPCDSCAKVRFRREHAAGERRSQDEGRARGRHGHIADEERWLASQLRQIGAQQFELDARKREVDRRILALKIRKRARSEATSRQVKKGITGRAVARERLRLNTKEDVKVGF